MQFFKRLKQDETGATAIEYGLIAALIAVALIAIFNGGNDSTASEEAVMKVSEAAPLND